MKSTKTEWDLSQLYKSPNDPRIEKDILIAEKAYKSFAKKYSKDKKYLSNENFLLKALKDYEKLNELSVGKTSFYLHLAKDVDTQNKVLEAKSNLLSQRLQKIANQVIFFGINLSKIDTKNQKKFLNSKKLSEFKYYLEKIFEAGKHTLTEPEEKVFMLKSLPSYSLWTNMVKKMESRLTVSHKGKEIPISEAQSIIRQIKSQKERIDLSSKIMEKFYGISEIAENELNAIVIDKKIDDEAHSFKEPYDATIFGYENDKKTVLNLVKIVTDNFKLAHKFYAIKKKILNVDKFHMVDRVAEVGKVDKKIKFDEAYDILYKLFISIDPKFGEILKNFLDKGQIDAFPKVGKVGGAYCSHNHNCPTYVLLNHVDSMDSLRTFAHEMGHALHSEFSRVQPSIYEGYSTSTAEVASTLFETFLFYDLFEKMTPEEKIVALHDKISDDVSTIFRQVACFNFELEMHKLIREKGYLSKEELASLMEKHLRSYVGEVDFGKNDGYMFVAWPHIRYFFYVYSYAFGQLTSKALYEKYKEDKTYIEKIKKFLSAGGSASPENIFKSIGVDLTKPDFFKKGIESIGKDIKLLESLISKK